MIINKRVYATIKQALQRQPAVALIGPRQVGKTTLAIQIAKEQSAIYLDLESREDRAKLLEPELFLSTYENKLVILDEIHKAPELFQTLRGLIDKGRRQGNKFGRFLILGSASIELLRQSGESLAGRISYIHMDPFDVLETVSSNELSLIKLWNRGGFPESYLAENDHNSALWRKDFIRTYLERDIPLFGPRIPSETLERLWTMLAYGQGTLLNTSKIAKSLMVSPQTINRYIDLLVDLLLIRRLPPFYKNCNKRLVKSPKIYVRDSGITHSLLGITDQVQLFGHPIVGLSWEAFVIENLLGVIPDRTIASFYRTAAGAEVDLILEIPNQGLWALEIKRGIAPTLSKGFYLACQDLTPNQAFVIYSGVDRYPLSKGVDAIGIYELAKLLASFTH